MKQHYKSTFVFSLFVLTWSANAQSLKVQILNGKNGKPLANQRVVLMGQSDSVAIRRIGDFHTAVDGIVTVSITDPHADSLDVYVEWHHPCAKKRVAFSLQGIISTGVVSENSCNSKLKRSSIPGTLILFVRDETFFEKMAH
jgi:hypothetical protein